MQTAAALAWPLLALISYPDKQKKCQEELDAVIGHARMPTFEDMDNLPYLKATVREALRWRAVTPLGRFSYVSGMNIVWLRLTSGLQHVTMQVTSSHLRHRYAGLHNSLQEWLVSRLFHPERHRLLCQRLVLYIWSFMRWSQLISLTGH